MNATRPPSVTPFVPEPQARPHHRVLNLGADLGTLDESASGLPILGVRDECGGMCGV